MEECKKELMVEFGDLSLDEAATNHDTWTHIHIVQKLLNKVQNELMLRALYHDQSKLSPPEVVLMTRYADSLGKNEFGSKEYIDTLKKLKPALDHHYAHNRHHPEHFENGIDDMNLIDIMEMFVDWKASSLRSKNGNIRKSITVLKDRFNISDQLFNILMNTVDYLYERK